MKQLNLSQINHHQTLMYFKEIGDMVALYVKDGQQYLVAWAGPSILDTGDLYVAVPVDETIIAAYLAKSITGHDIQKQASEIFLGAYVNSEIEFNETTFSYLVENEHAMAIDTSIYDDYFKPEGEQDAQILT